jgi:hypothetical protein
MHRWRLAAGDVLDECQEESQALAFDWNTVEVGSKFWPFCAG